MLANGWSPLAGTVVGATNSSSAKFEFPLADGEATVNTTAGAKYWLSFQSTGTNLTYINLVYTTAEPTAAQ